MSLPPPPRIPSSPSKPRIRSSPPRPQMRSRPACAVQYLAAVAAGDGAGVAPPVGIRVAPRAIGAREGDPSVRAGEGRTCRLRHVEQRGGQGAVAAVNATNSMPRRLKPRRRCRNFVLIVSSPCLRCIALCMEGLAERDSDSRLAGWGENARGRREYDRRRGIARSTGPVQHEPGVNRGRQATRDL